MSEHRTQAMADAWLRTSTSPGRRYRIFVELDPKPIPDRRHDWNAWIDGEEEMGTATGATPQEALENLCLHLEVLES